MRKTAQSSLGSFVVVSQLGYVSLAVQSEPMQMLSRAAARDSIDDVLWQAPCLALANKTQSNGVLIHVGFIVLRFVCSAGSGGKRLCVVMQISVIVHALIKVTRLSQSVYYHAVHVT